MRFSRQLKIAALVLIILVVQSQQAPCRKHLKAKKTLKHIRKDYFLVEKPSVRAVQPFPGLIRKRDVSSESPTDSKYCPWRWVRDTRLPRSRFNLLKAECVGKCKSYCKPVYYTMKVLVKKGRDSRARMDVWTVRQRRTVVAYVYNGTV